MTHHTYHRPTRLTAIAVAACMLASCGGGGGSGGSAAPSAGAASGATPAASSTATPDAAASAASAAAAPGTTAATVPGAIATGTVTGFGSVIVDGRRIDDRNAPAGIEQEDGTIVNTELKLGHHVEIRHGDDLVASEVRVSAGVRGVVESVSASAGRLQVLGQTVTINTLPAAGPVTVFEAPYAQLADIRSGDVVEVHGVQQTEFAGAVTLQATRIERKPATVPARVRGTVLTLSPNARTFRIGGLLVRYGSALVKPDASALKVGAEIDLMLPAGSTAATAAGVDAVKVSVKVRHGGAAGQDAAVAGPVTVLDAAARTYRIDGVRIDAANARFDTAGQGFADLAAGVYARVKGRLGEDGSVAAASISLPQREHAAGREVELHGSILGLSASGGFRLRDVPVSTAGATIRCPAGTVLANGMQVEVEGRLAATGEVVAADIKCEDMLEDVSIVERTGTASAVNAAARTLTLGAGTGAITVRWSTGTVFAGTDVASLSGRLLEVEGTLSGNVLTAKKIKPEN